MSDPSESPLEVLVVEDDPAYAHVLRVLLGESEVACRSTVVGTLADAVAALSAAARPFDVVLLDLGLPDADGMEAVETVHQHPSRCPIVVLSGHDSVDIVLEAMRSGAQEYLVKGQSERHLLPRAMRSAIERKRLQDFERMLIAVVGHDLRNPLQAIALSNEAMTRVTDPATRDRLLARSRRAIQRANALIHDVLDFTRLRLGGALPVLSEDTDLAAIVADVIEETRAAHPDRTIHLDSPGSVPRQGDRGRLAQVIANLVGNALQHSPAGSDIRVSVVKEADDAAIRVHNQGRAIPPELQPKLFQPMERGPEAGPNPSRSIGLGLYIVSEIVKSHGGHLGVHSTASDGTTFEVRLPACQPPASAPPRL